MSIPYELLVEEDLHLGYGEVSVTMPAGGSAVGHKVGAHTFHAGYSVLDFGADPTGQDSANPAFVAALALIRTAGGGRLLVPPGTYKISDTLWVPGNTSIVGAGMGVTTLVASPVLPDHMITTASATASNIVLRDFTLDGSVGANVISDYAIGGLGVVGVDLGELHGGIHYATNVVAARVEIKNFIRYGVYVELAKYVRLIGLHVHDCRGEWLATSGFDVTATACAAHDNDIDGVEVLGSAPGRLTII